MEAILPQVSDLFSRDGRFTRWLQVEAALANAQGALGIIPAQAARDISEAAHVEKLALDRYDEFYAKTGHPMVSMLRLLEAAAGPESGQYIHLGATTQDIMDSAMTLALRSMFTLTRAKLVSIQSSVLDLKEQINQVENSLALLLAETPRYYERGELGVQQFPDNFSLGVPMQMLANRPDVRSAERTLEAAFYGTNQARSAFYPSITLSGSAGWTNNAGSMIVNPGKFLASAVGSLTQPLFARGEIIAQYKITKLQQEEAALAFQQSLLNAGSEVNDALTACQTSREKSFLLDKQITSLEAALKSTSLLMEHGTTTYLEVLTARQSLLSAQLTRTANRFTEIQSVINLYRALGGGRE